MPCWMGTAWIIMYQYLDRAEGFQQQGVAVLVPFIPPLRTLQCESTLGALLGVLEVWAKRFPCLSSPGSAGWYPACFEPPLKHQCWVLVGFCWAGGSIRFAFSSPALQPRPARWHLSTTESCTTFPSLCATCRRVTYTTIHVTSDPGPQGAVCHLGGG